MKKVCMVVPNAMVKGGIASVVNGYHGSQLEKDYKIIYVESYKDGGKITKFFKAISGYFHFTKVLLIDKPDLVHIHSSFGPSFYRKIPFIYMASWARIPIVNHIHGADFDEFYINASNAKRAQIKKVYDKCNALIALSSEWKDKLSQIVDADKIVVIENYSVLHEDAYNERLSRKCNNQVLFLGEIGQRKGCYDIPDIIKKVSEKIPNVMFVLCGAGKEEDEKAIKALIKENNVEKNVKFLGWVRDKQKDQVLRDADIFFLPSYNEGMPMSVLDAMGYGLPIVSTNVGGIPKIVHDGENGFICEPGAKSDMAKFIVNVLLNTNSIKSMGKNSLEIVKGKHSLNAHITKIESVYERIQ